MSLPVTSIDEDFTVTPRMADYASDTCVSNLSRWMKLSLLGKEYSFLFGDDEQTRAMKESYNGRYLQAVPCGKGKVYFVGIPVELSTDIEKIASFYAQIMDAEKISLPFTAQKSAQGIFISRVQWENGACFYTAVNENDNEETVTITDHLHHKSFELTIAPNDVNLFAVNVHGEKTAEY